MPNYLNNHSVRGIRNNNPGNLIRTSIAWQGKIPFPQSKDAKFEQFKSMEYGIRAMLRDIVSDINKGKNTVKLLITEYAPSFENNTDAYINSVAKTLGISATQSIKTVNRSFLKMIARAIIKVECGSSHTAVTDSQIDKALDILGSFETKNVQVNNVINKSNAFIAVLVFFYSFLACII